MDAVKRVEAGFSVPDICRELGISTATFYKWRAKYGGMDVSMMSRMKELEEENRRLKKMSSLEEVQEFATRWMWSYNNHRPNMALGGFTPKQKLAMAA
jgi:putative transposase